MKKTSILIFLAFIGVQINAQSLKVISNQTTIPLGSSYWITNTFPFNDANVRLRLHARADNFNAAFIDYWQNLYFRSGATNSNTTMHISDNGFVGINGVAIPARITTTSNGTFNLRSNFRLQAYGNAISNDWYTFSDSALKENITPITNVLTQIQKMHPIEYNYKSAKLSENSPTSDSTIDSTNINPTTDPKRRYGFTAQEVKRVFPNLESEFNENLGVVNYVGFVPLLVKAVQEQQTIIENQTLEIAQLRQEIVNWKGRSIDTPSDKTRLFQNNPNPFNGVTTFTYFIDENSTVTNSVIEIRNIMGTLQSTLTLGDQSGLGSIDYNGTNLNQGFYIYTLKINGSIKDSKMFLKEN